MIESIATKCNTCHFKTPVRLTHPSCEKCKHNPYLLDNYITWGCCSFDEKERIEDLIKKEVTVQVEIAFREKESKRLMDRIRNL